MSITLKKEEALRRMRVAGRIVAETFALLDELIRPGVALRDLDQLAEEYIASQGAAPLYKGYKGSGNNHPPFPGVICASLNQEICHGIPDERTLREGDIIAIDIGLIKDGYCGDSCITFPVGEISPEAQRLLEVTQECLRLGIRAAKARRPLTDIGEAIEGYANSQGMTVVREWGGHGIGQQLHEPPSVSHIRERRRGIKMRPGMTFTIEPMVNLGTHEWRMLEDGWTVVTKDDQLSAQFEHTVAITENGPEILTKL